MAVPSFIAARRVCELRDWTVSNLPLNKILYFAHMVALGRSDGAQLLVNERFQAWDYGPVLPSVYRAARGFGKTPVRDVFPRLPLNDSFLEEILVEVVGGLEDKSPGELIAITHWEDGAWARHYVPGELGIVIPNEDILAEYRLRVG